MRRSEVKAPPMSRLEIRQFALKIRSFLGYKGTDYINAPKLFDRLSVLFEKSGLVFDYRVLTDDDPLFEDKEEAFTDMSTGIIYIKESVMEQACRRSFKRGAFTLIHELGHYLLHYLQGGTKLARIEGSENVPIYCDPEWQADNFASEFLMPFDECRKMEIEEIRKAYHVSRAAAEVRYEIVRK